MRYVATIVYSGKRVYTRSIMASSLTEATEYARFVYAHAQSITVELA